MAGPILAEKKHNGSFSSSSFIVHMWLQNIFVLQSRSSQLEGIWEIS